MPGEAGSGPHGSAFLSSGMNGAEQANAGLVLNFFESLDYGPFFAAEARLRWESGIQSPVQWDMRHWQNGLDEIGASAKIYSDMGVAVRTDVHGVHARGPLVFVDGTDHMTLSGEPLRSTRMIGVFMVINGRIVEWSDYCFNRMPGGEGTD